MYLYVVEKTREALTIIVDGKLIYTNQAFANLIGAKTARELLGREAIKWVVPTQRKKGMDFLPFPFFILLVI